MKSFLKTVVSVWVNLKDDGISLILKYVDDKIFYFFVFYYTKGIAGKLPGENSLFID